MVNEDFFENLKGDGYEITSPADEFQNCIAFAAGVESEWWDPNGLWPDGVPREDTVENIIKVYECHGFVLCSDGNPETGFEKIAIYATEDIYQHAARLLADGRWGSKLGAEEDITHPTVTTLEGRLYGNVVAYMKRNRL